MGGVLTLWTTCVASLGGIIYHIIMSLDALPHSIPPSARMSMIWGVLLLVFSSFFSLYYSKKYRLILFVVHISTSLLILLISNFLSLALFLKFYLFSI